MGNRKKREYNINIRLNALENSMLTRLSDKHQISASELLRLALHSQYLIDFKDE